MMKTINKITKKLQKENLSEVLDEIKWMYLYAKKYWYAIFFYTIMGVAGTIMGLLGNLMTKFLIDIVTGQKTSAITLIAVLMVVMGIGNIVLNCISSRISAYFSVKVKNEIQADVYNKIMEADWESLHEFRSGDLLNRLSSDVTTASDSIIGWIPNLFTKLVQFLGALVIILYYDPTMALISLISAPVSIVISRLLLGKMRKFNRELRQTGSELMSYQEDSFQNMQSIKAFDIVSIFETGMLNLQKKYKEITMDYNKISILSTGIMSFTGMIISYVCLGWGVYRLWTGAIAFGTLTLFLQLSSSLASSFSALVSLAPQGISATTCAGRIMAVTNLPAERSVDEEKAANINKRGEKEGIEVHIEELNFSYNDGREVLRNINLSAKPGNIVALIGPSGEGKTTLLRIFLGLINPSSGKAYISNNHGEKCEISNATRKIFSYVPQGNTIFAGTIEENLLMVKPEATMDEMREALNMACALEFVDNLPQGIKSEIKERGKGLSEGQAQRISIARALLRDAPVILLDEATSALDVSTERKVLNNILNNNKNKTCIVTTHRPSVLNMCQSVYRVDSTTITKVSEEEAAKLAEDF